MIWQTTGAQVLSLSTLENQGHKPGPELFYLSPIFKPNTPARGGVPVLFPQFADKGKLQKHGYARNTPWTLDKELRNEHSHLAQFSLEVGKTTWPDWPYAARLRLTVEQQFKPRTALEMVLTVTNTGDEAFEFTGGLHPYFVIEKPEHFKLLGLNGCPMQDKLDPELCEESSSGPSLNGTELERLYLDALLHAPELRLEGSPLGTVTLSSTGFTNWMVWNPGVELAKGIADLPDADWTRFVCVEPVIADKPLKLEVGEVFTGTLSCHWS